jgi:outer membrane protein assembly factor BamB
MNKLNYLLPLLFISSTLSAQNIVDWRFDRTGHYSKEIGLLKSWSSNGPELMWHFEGLGRGYTTATIDRNQIFITGETDDRGYLYVLSSDGKLQRKIEFGEEFTRSYPGARNMVIVDDGKLYVVSGTMNLYCYSIQSLNLLWSKSFTKDFEAENTRHGWHGTPLIVGDKLIIAPGGKKHNVVALNKATGDIIWSSEGAGDMSGYGSPIYLSDQQVPQVIFMMANHIIGLDVSNGKMLWSFEHTNRMREHPNTPIYSNNMLYFMSSYGKGSTMLRLSNGGRHAEKVWEAPELGHQMGHAIKFGDIIYGCGQRSGWYGVDWQTGKVAFRDSTLSVGNVISADGLLYLYSDKGDLALVKPNPQKLEIISKFSITLGTGEHWSHPTIHNGVMYVRHGDALMAYKVKN